MHKNHFLNRTFIFLIFLASGLISSAQIEGDNIFGTNQVISIDLQFPDADFWNTLISDYSADEGAYVPAELTLTDVTGAYVIDSIGVRLKGNSSYGHPGNKKSFKLDFNKFVPGQNYDGLKKLNFSNCFKDPSMMREKVFFDVCQAAGVPAPRTSFANVTMNGTPWGFYTLVEQIDDQFLDWRILDDSGNLFKAGDNFGGGPGGGTEAADLVYYGAAQNSYEAKYELKTNEDINDWTDLIDFIDYINNSSDAVFAAEIESRMEFSEYIRSVALDNLFSNLDSYTGSARNYYVYHNQTTNRWEWIKWDANEAFGSYSNGVNGILNLVLDYRSNNRPLLDRIFSDPVIYDQYLSEVCEIREEFFNSTFMDGRIDIIKALIQESVYADNNKMYSNANFDTNIENNITSGGGPGGATIYGLKSFVTQRNSYLDGILDCSMFTSLEEPADIPFTISPNPADDFLRIQWNGGEFIDLRLIDSQGRAVANIASQGNSILEVDVRNLAPGTYFLLSCSSSGKTKAKQVIIE